MSRPLGLCRGTYIESGNLIESTQEGNTKRELAKVIRDDFGRGIVVVDADSEGDAINLLWHLKRKGFRCHLPKHGREYYEEHGIQLHLYLSTKEVSTTHVFELKDMGSNEFRERYFNVEPVTPQKAEEYYDSREETKSLLVARIYGKRFIGNKNEIYSDRKVRHKETGVIFTVFYHSVVTGNIILKEKSGVHKKKDYIICD